MKQAAIDLVDDDPAVLKALSRLLRAHGLPVTTFASGSEFLKALGPERACILLIIDVQMPEMSGLEVCAKLRSMKCNAPVIYVTAYEDQKAEQLAMSSGAVAFLYKPVRGEALCAAVRKALQQAAPSPPVPGLPQHN
jgi:FixJ family two-component response regulator